MTRIVILAAGRGTRMNSDLPKALVPLKGKAMIEHLLDSVDKSGVDKRPIVVVSPDNKNIIKPALHNYKVEFVVQKKQLGTGHAVVATRNLIGKESSQMDNIVVLYADHPFVSAASIRALAEVNQTALTIMPTTVPEFSGWYQGLYHWGRIIRDDQGNVEAIVEFKDASEEQRLIKEVNPGFMSFNKNWLFANLDYLNAENQQHEYYLTDLAKIAFIEGHRIGAININPREALGINSQKELKAAESL